MDGIAAVIFQQLLQRNASIMLAFNHRLGDSLLDISKRQRRDNVPKIEHYFELTVPKYNLDDFRSHFRVTRYTFEALCSRLASTEGFTNERGPHTRVDKAILMFLWYIGNLECFRSMADRFGVSKSSLHQNVKKVSSSLVSIMPEVVQWPRGEKIQQTSVNFLENCPFQNVIGALDGTHIQITAPKHQPQSYFNRKKFYSVVLLASCNANLEFTFAWTGNPGSMHDASVLRGTDLFQKCDQLIPPGYYLLGDSAFPIMHWLITPFRDYGNLGRLQKKFNHVHSKCRQVIERAFGLLKARFRRLLRFEVSDLSILVDSILAACVLHNLCEDSGQDFLEELGQIEDFGDDCYVRDGCEADGMRMRQQLMLSLDH